MTLPRLALALILLINISGPLGAAGRYEPTMPSDPSRIEFYLHTIDVGDLLWNNFGHTAIRVVNPEEGTDMVYNWGIFDFSNPISFGFTFYKGILIYQLGIYPYATARRIYHAEGRKVWEDRLNLTTAQKERLMARLVWHAEEDHRSYRYDYFYDNCSTRPRDFIDEATGGAVKLGTTAQTGESFRDMVRSHYATIPFVRVSLDILMNSRIDLEMSLWQKMFLPKTLRDALLTIPNPELSQDSSTRILEPLGVISDFPTPVPPPSWVYGMTLLVCTTLLGSATVLAMRRRRIPKGLYRTVGAIGWIIAFLAGGYGLLMPLTWVSSEHLDLHHNINQALFWPFDWVFLAPATAWLFKGRNLRLSPKAKRVFGIYLSGHLLAIAAYLVLFLGGAFTQNVAHVASFSLVLMTFFLAFCYATNRWEEP